MENALIALLGVLIGVLCNEYFRRENRIEKYSEKMFDKRLEIHEHLYQKIQESASVIDDIINDERILETDRQQYVSNVILGIADFLEPIEFYLDQNLIVQVMTVFMGAEDIVPSHPNRNELIKVYRQNLKATKVLIQDTCGVKRANENFINVTRTKFNTPILKYFKKIRSKDK